MPYQLSIRRISTQHGDLLAAARICTLAAAPFRVGTTSGCDVALSESIPHGTEMVVRPDSTGAGWLLALPADAASGTVTKNGLPVEKTTPLKNGDEIRFGDYTIRFEQLFDTVKTARHTDLIARAAKVLVGCVIIGELMVVTWLPGWLHTTRLWDREVARQQTTMFLDKVRTQLKEFDPAGPLEAGMRDALTAELNRLAAFLRTEQDSLSADQWRNLRTDLNSYEDALERLTAHTAIQPVPALDIDGAVRAVAGAQ